MPLDFSGLFGAKKKEQPAAEQEKQGALLQELQNGGSRNPYREIEQEQAAREASLEEYKRLQAARSRSAQKQTELLKGIAEGKDPAELFIIALECISDATGNNYYKTVAAQQFLDIYGGGGLQMEKPVEMELQQVEARLDRLREAAGRENSENIKRAIRAHEKKAADLRAILQKV